MSTPMAADLTVAILPPLMLGVTNGEFAAASGQRCTIYRAPPTMREVDPDNYEPKLVSIGPYHHGTPGLKAMQNHKRRYLRDFLQRCPGLTFEECLKEVKGTMEARARACYWDDTTHLSSDQFAEMLLLDGCFILNFLFKLKKDETSSSNTLLHDEGDDPVFSTKWMCPIIVRDLLLLENQVPLFVLQLLFGRFVNAVTPSRFEGLCMYFCDYVLQATKQIRQRESATLEAVTADHLLHLFHLYCGLPLILEQTAEETATHRDVIFVLKEHSEIRSFIHVEKRGRIVKMPPLSINPLTIFLLGNLMALEECSRTRENCFSKYAIFMGCILKNSSEDGVWLLEKKGIIQNELAGKKEVGIVFSRLCEGLGVANPELRCDLRWSIAQVGSEAWLRVLSKTYFDSPWAAVNIQATLVTIFLAVTQTLLAYLALKAKK